MMAAVPATGFLPAPLLGQRQQIARTRDAARPGLVEIGDQSLEAVGLERRIEPRHVGKLIGRVVHTGVCRAPKAPALLGLEFGKCHRQVMGRIPMIEFLPQRLCDHRAHHEIGFGHRPPYSPRMPAALMIGHHFSISALWNAARPAGVCCTRGAISSPSSANRMRTFGSASASTNASLSLAMTDRGVPLGANRPNHPDM